MQVFNSDKESYSVGRCIELALQNIPVIGHVIGVAYYVKGDKREAQKASCRATFGLIGCIFEALNEIGRNKSNKLQHYNTYNNINLKLQDNELCHWMSCYPNHKINQVWIPGSHESATYSIPNSIVNAWSICQILTIYQQLMTGIRYLDLRVITVGDDVFIAHRFKGCKLSECLQEITQFLCTHPTEVVLMRLDHNKTGGDCDNAILNDVLKKHIYEYIVKNDEFENDTNIATISELTKQGTKGRILLLSPVTNLNLKSLNARLYTYQSSWDNYHCQYPYKWYQNYTEFVANYETYKNVDFVLMACEVTPEKNVVIQSVASEICRGFAKCIGSLFVKEQFTDLEDLCSACNYQVKKFLTNEQLPEHPLLVSHDYINPDIIKLILAKNNA